MPLQSSSSLPWSDLGQGNSISYNWNKTECLPKTKNSSKQTFRLPKGSRDTEKKKNTDKQVDRLWCSWNRLIAEAAEAADNPRIHKKGYV